MGQEQDSPAYLQFVQWLRGALNHLYEPSYLRRSPLVEMFGFAGQADAHARLQQLLTEAIGAMEPKRDEPSDAPVRWIHEILFDRYVQQLSQQEVADHLGICLRHLRRRQHVALETLATRLWKRAVTHAQVLGEPIHDARVDAQVLAGPSDGTGPGGSRAPEAAPSLNEELAWLEQAPVETPVALDDVLPSVFSWAEPLAARHSVQVAVSPCIGLPSLTVHPVALSQILLSLLSVAIAHAPGGQVDLAAEAEEQRVVIRVSSSASPSRATWLAGEGAESLEVARRLAELSGGTLRLAASGGRLEVTVSLPAEPGRQLVLAIDDNPDTLQLLRRFTVNTRYRLVGKQDPSGGLQAALELSPAVIVLDVMMPQVEGWEVLARLRQHPGTSHIPVVVCTILSQRDLALSLGASDFVRKPLTREGFLAALDRQTGAAKAAR